ncbi:DUF302 domain-containing protein [Ruegeria marina]|uniref:DUF302 domain-containing protein n=1 Tax=Ruegeria marina TaxID=639004 RepID=A0A1G6N1X9_9RHOB|nr:DUF302 domain-containing protein [Ruegeria marina]SDC61457.1 hypothetical protein SAMN04488239_1034 [Ruegeria marina]
MKQLMMGLALAAAAGAASAQDMITYSADESFSDIAFAVESAIVGRGLVVDHVSYVGDMLERTRMDVGSDVILFEKAEVYTFCSATVSRRVMEADPMNIVFCPYGIFVAQKAGSEEVLVGFRSFPEGPMQEVQELLDGIVREAVGE